MNGKFKEIPRIRNLTQNSKKKKGHLRTLEKAYDKKKKKKSVILTITSGFGLEIFLLGAFFIL